MSRILKVVAVVLQSIALLLFCVLMCFWLIVAIRSAHNLAEGGLPEAQRWFFRIMLKPDEVIPPIPHYGTVVAVRLGELAAVTVVLGLASRKMINQVMKLLRNRAGGPVQGHENAD